MGLWVDAVYRIREALQTVHQSDQDVLKATIFQLPQHAQPELCTFIFGQSHTQQFFLAFGVETRCQGDGYVILTNFDDNAVHIENEIQRIQL